METAIDGNGKRSATRRRTYLGIAVALVVVVGAAWVAIDRSGGQGKSQRSGALVIGNAEYPNVVTVAGDNVAGDDYGSGATQLRGPSKVVLDAAGNLYVADTQNYRVQKFVSGCVNTETSKCAGVTVAGGNLAGSAANQLNTPFGVAFDANGNLYVADTFNHRVQKFVSGCVNTETSKCAGVTVAGGNLAGSAANQLNTPFGVAVDSAGNVFVADSYNHRVQKFASGCVNTETSKCAGVTVAGGNGYGLGATQLTEPYGVAVDSAGNVFVADTRNHRVQKFASGCVSTSTSKCAGVTVAGGNGYGSAANQLNRPEGVALDAEGNVYVADTFNYRVQRWAPGATAGVTVASDDGYGSFGNWPFDPQGLAVDSNLNLYVVDGVNNRVHKWSP